MVKRYSRMMLYLFKAGDLLVAAAAWCAAYGMRIAASRLELTPFPPPPFSDFVPAMVLSMVLALLLFSRFDLYEPQRTKSLLRELADVLRAILLAWALTFVVATFSRREMPSRAMMGSVLIAWSALGVLHRIAARMTLRGFRRRGWNTRSAAIVGAGRVAQKLFHALRHSTWTGIQPTYFIDDSRRDRPLRGLPVHGPIDRIEEILAQAPADIVFVALPVDAHDRVEQVLNRLAATNVDVRVVPDLLSFHFLRHDVSELNGLPVIALTSSPQHGWNSLLKRAFDLLVAAAGLALLALPMLLIALAVRLGDGRAVFYRQVRTSLGGREFRILKFRTMVPDAEADTGPVWTAPDDPRVTPVGRFLRRTSLDELPQLFNVLLGQMSLVGPRPERPELIERFRRQVPRYMLRQQVKAGLTGWAQVHGLRGQTSLRKRVQYDLYYISNWTFGLDLRILLMTPFRSLFHRNAY